MVYSFNEALYVYPLDAASDQAMVLCEVPAQQGSTIRFAMPADLVELLKMFDGRREVAEVFAAYDKLNPGKYSLPKLESLVESFLLPKSLLVDRNTPALLPEISSKRTSYLFGKVRLIPQHIVYPIAKLFGWAFDKRVLISWLTIFVLAHLIFYLWLLPNHRADFSHFGGATFSVVMLLSLLGAFIHETGHASALVAYGCKQTEIGFGIYFYYPVLYTDVSEAWKLSRHQRAMIDMGGVYFQSVFQLLLLGLFFINGSSVPIYFFLFTDLIMFRTMNPFLRMDGYWLVADLFGIFNLRQQSTKLIQHYFIKLFGVNRADRTPLHTLKPGARVALAVYSALSAVFFFYICAIMIRFSIFYMLPVYPARLMAVWQVVQHWPLDASKLFKLVFEVLWRTAVLVSLSLFAYRLLQTAWGVLKFLAQTLWQKFRKILTVDDPGVGPVSSSGN
jgi:putative peptide zinc metalloprotease protein